MLRYGARRVGLAVLVVLGTLIITFFIARVVPANPARLYAGGIRATTAEVNRARVALGLNRPLPVQFVGYMLGVAHGDFGMSLTTRRPVVDDLEEFFPATAELVIPAMALAVILGIPIGVAAAARRGGFEERLARILSLSGVSIAPFWLALVAQMVFADWLGWLPVGNEQGSNAAIYHPVAHVTGFLSLDALVTGNWPALGDSLLHLVLPVAVLTVYPLSLVIRHTRASFGDVMSELFVTAARAQGMAERTVLYRWVLRSAIAPTLTVVGLAFAGSLTGTVLIEVIFSWPGIGRYVTTAITAGDFGAVIAVVTIGTVAYVVTNLVVDLIQAWLDPRIRL